MRMLKLFRLRDNSLKGNDPKTILDLVSYTIPIGLSSYALQCRFLPPSEVLSQYAPAEVIYHIICNYSL